jgi:hypothetical protein
VYIWSGIGSDRAAADRFDPEDRARVGLPPRGTGIVFANFNKNEKLEPGGGPVAPLLYRCAAAKEVSGRCAWLVSAVLSVFPCGICGGSRAVAWGVWMGILRRVPGSVLWLLEPVQSVASRRQLQQLVREAQAAGVHPSRIVFAPRCASMCAFA